jgi:hypothetical protein
MGRAEGSLRHYDFPAFPLAYRMVRYGQNYVEQGIHHYELKFQLQRIKWLKKEAQSLNLQLVPATSTTSSWREGFAKRRSCLGIDPGPAILTNLIRWKLLH